MKSIMLFLTLLMASLTAFAQMQTIQLDAKQLHFDNGRPLPAEETFIVNTGIPASVSLVKMQISNRDFEKRILNESVWLRREGDASGFAAIPNYYILRSNDRYNFRVMFYRRIVDEERSQIFEMLKTSADSYLRLNIQKKGEKYILLNSPSAIYNALNTLIAESMTNYEVGQGIAQPKFSGIIENMLRTMAGKRFLSESDNEVSSTAFTFLINQINNEIFMISNSFQFMITDAVTIMNYPTEKKMNTIAINLGYGGIYDGGNFSDLSYYSAPYVGLSLPFGNKTFSGNFWGNSFLSTGVFLKNFTAENGNAISGPLIDLPIFLGLGHRAFRFIKVQAGAVVLEERDKINDTKSVYLAPFAGLSIEFNIWIGLNK